MATNLGEIRAAINADNKSWNKGFGDATKTLKGFGTAVPRLLKPVGMAVAAMGAAAIGAASYLTIKTTQLYAGFQADMANVSTMIRTNSKEMTDELGDAVLRLSRDVPQATTQLTSALYDILSASVPVAESMTVLGASGKAAVAGVSDVQTAANLATGTINALGMSFKDVDKVFDVAFATVLTGKITFEQLAGSLGQVLPSAKKMNVSIEEVYGSIAFLTKNAFSADMASISLARTLDALGTKSDLLENMGIKIFGEEGDYVGIVEVMEQIAAQIDGLTEKAQVNLFEKMGFDVRAARAVVTMATNLDAFKTTMDEVRASAGKAGEAYEKLSKTLTFQWDLLKNSFSELWINIGEGFGEIAATGIGSITKLVTSVSDLITGGGGLVNLWMVHRDIVVKLLEGMATSGLEFVGQFAIGVGEILMAVALPAWEEFDRAVRRTREGTIHWLVMQYEKYLDYSGDANGRIAGEYERHTAALEAIDVHHAIAQKEAIDKSIDRLKAAGKIGVEASVKLYDDFRTALEIANTDLQNEIASTSTATAEKQASIYDKAWAWIADGAQKTRDQIKAAASTGDVVIVGLDKRMRAVREANEKADQALVANAQKAKEDMMNDAAAMPGQLAAIMRQLQREFQAQQDRWENQRADLAQRDEERLEKAQENERVYNAKMLADSIKYFADKGIALGKLDEKTLERRLKMLERFQGREIDNYKTQRALIESEYDKMLVAYNTFGEDTVELERWRADQILALRVTEVDKYVDGLDIQMTAFSDFTEGHAGLYGTWLGDLFGMSDDFHETTLSQFGDWAKEQIDLLGDINTMWKSLIETWETAKGVIRTLTDLYGKIFGSDGGGGAIGTAGNIAALAGGGGADAGALAGGASMLGKVGGGIKAGAGAVAKGVGTAASGVGAAAAAAAPWLLPAAGVAIAYKFVGGIVESLSGWDLPWIGSNYAKEKEAKQAEVWESKGFSNQADYTRAKNAERLESYNADYIEKLARQKEESAAITAGLDKQREAVTRYASDLNALHSLFKDGNRFAEEQIRWLMKQGEAYDGVSASLNRVTASQDVFSKKLGRDVGLLTNITGAAFKLSDELAGHSLTTAFDATAKSADAAGGSYQDTGRAAAMSTSEIQSAIQNLVATKGEQQKDQRVMDRISRESEERYRAELLGVVYGSREWRQQKDWIYNSESGTWGAARDARVSGGSTSLGDEYAINQAEQVKADNQIIDILDQIANNTSDIGGRVDQNQIGAALWNIILPFAHSGGYV